MRSKIVLCIAGLCEGVVTLPDALLSIAAGVVLRMVVVVRAFEHFPVVEAHPAFRRNGVRPSAPVDVPFPDVRRVVASGCERLGQARRVRPRMHVVDEHAVRERSLSRHQAGAIGRADGIAGNRLREVDALSGQCVEIRRLDIRIAGVSGRLLPPLIGEDKNHIHRARSRFVLNAYGGKPASLCRFGIATLLQQYRTSTGSVTASALTTIRLPSMRASAG